MLLMARLRTHLLNLTKCVYIHQGILEKTPELKLCLSLVVKRREFTSLSKICMQPLSFIFTCQTFYTISFDILLTVLLPLAIISMTACNLLWHVQMLAVRLCFFCQASSFFCFDFVYMSVLWKAWQMNFLIKQWMSFDYFFIIILISCLKR